MSSNLRVKEIQYNDQHLFINWSNGSASEIGLLKLRKLCPCAECRGGDFGPLGAKTGHIKEASISSLSFVGNYALNIVWGDSHNTGLYSFETLLEYSKD